MDGAPDVTLSLESSGGPLDHQTPALGREAFPEWPEEISVQGGARDLALKRALQHAVSRLGHDRGGQPQPRGETLQLAEPEDEPLGLTAEPERDGASPSCSQHDGDSFCT